MKTAQPSARKPSLEQPKPACLLLILMSFTLWAVSPALASQPLQFAAPVNYTCTNAEQICTGDFNGDGLPDLVVSSSVTHMVTIFTNRGTGSFVMSTNYTSPGTPHSLAVGDFNADNKLDILVVNYPNDSLVVWTGNGNGTFAPAKVSSVSINDSYTGVAVGDFNNDGKLDVVVASYGPQIFLGQGNGYFGFFANYNFGTTYGVATGFFDGDTNLDIVTANYSSSSMTVFLAAGDGTFPSHTSYSGDNSEYHYGVATGDFNNDGKPDLATINYYFSSISVRTNTGNGAFGAETRYKTPSSPGAIVVSDFNGDGNVDILTANSSTSYSLAIFVGKGDATFAAAITNFPGLLGSVQNQSIAVADFNGDGRPDIASTCTAANSVSIRLNQTVPELQIQPVAAGKVKCAWPNWTGYVLESTTNLMVPNSWTAVAGSPVCKNGQNILTNICCAGNEFFRLRK